MEHSSSQQIKVGIFLIVGLFITSASIFLLGADKALFTNYIRLKSQFSQVQGLAKGSVVSLSGVTVGNVESIDFMPTTGKLNVVLKVDEKYASQIPSDSKVEIRTQGALGDKYVYIITGDYQQGTVRDSSELVVAESADILGIISSRGSETERVFDIINEVYKITTTLNKEQRLEKIMADFSTTAGNLKLASADIKSIASDLKSDENTKNLKESLEKLNKTMTKIDQGKGTLGLLVNDASLHEQLKKLTGDSKRKEHLKGSIRSSINED